MSLIFNEIDPGTVRDLVPRLPRRKSGGPGWGVELYEKSGMVIHYYGGPVPPGDDEATIRSIAHYHISHNWASRPDLGVHLSGDGIMYHLVIGRHGKLFQVRDFHDVLWHCGSWPENRTHLSVLVLIGGEQRANKRQLDRLRDLTDRWLASGRPRHQVIGHGEVSPTSCPGTLMTEFVLPFRDEPDRENGEPTVTTEGRYFPETDAYIGGAFWNYWRETGGMLIFGLPLSSERDELCEDGETRTVQYFERAVMEWHPEKAVRFQVLLRRLGFSSWKQMQERETAG